MATTVNSSEKALQSLGRYQDLEHIAEGGMGTVYRARDPFNGNEVALKVLQPAIAENPVLLKRFRQEFKAASTLNHPHIVRALDLGQAEGRYFIVLEYVDGISLGERIECQGRLSEAEAIQLIGQVAAALHHAHEKGFLHRDVKPDNILLSSSGQAKLTDLGLVKVQDAEVELTRAGKGLGTPYFMAPEQLADAKTVDRRADVYGLGATLYECLTGVEPYRGSVQLVLSQVLDADPVSPRRLKPDIPLDLETICLKAMAKEPGRRYQTMIEFRDDLRRWLRGEPVLARPVGRVAVATNRAASRSPHAPHPPAHNRRNARISMARIIGQLAGACFSRASAYPWRA